MPLLACALRSSVYLRICDLTHLVEMYIKLIIQNLRVWLVFKPISRSVAPTRMYGVAIVAASRSDDIRPHDSAAEVHPSAEDLKNDIQ